jgi:hypothetical protein
MKKLIVILTLGFLVGFSAKSEAWGYRYCGWHRCWAPRPVVVVRPCLRPLWIAPHWAWDYRWHRNVWVRGYWR